MSPPPSLCQVGPTPLPRNPHVGPTRQRPEHPAEPASQTVRAGPGQGLPLSSSEFRPRRVKTLATTTTHSSFFFSPSPPPPPPLSPAKRKGEARLRRRRRRAAEVGLEVLRSLLRLDLPPNPKREGFCAGRVGVRTARPPYPGVALRLPSGWFATRFLVLVPLGNFGVVVVSWSGVGGGGLIQFLGFRANRSPYHETVSSIGVGIIAIGTA